MSLVLCDATGDDWHLPDGVARRIPNCGDHVVEMRHEPLACDWRVLRYGVGVSVAPRRKNRGKSLARNAQRVDDDVVDGDVGEAEPLQNAVRPAADAQVGAERLAEAARHDGPEIVGIESIRLEMNHQVVFGNQVNPAAAFRHPHKLRDRLIGVRDRLQDVPAHHKIEGAGGKPKVEDTAVFEGDAPGGRRTFRTGAREMIVDHVDAEDGRLRQQRRQSCRDFARAASGIEQSGIGRQPVRSNSRCSCGQMASACAARFLTIDSSAISLACGLSSLIRGLR